MPNYEYRCGEGHINVETRALSDRNTSAYCQVCNEPAYKIISLPADRIRFNGSKSVFCEGREYIVGTREEEKSVLARNGKTELGTYGESFGQEIRDILTENKARMAEASKTGKMAKLAELPEKGKERKMKQMSETIRKGVVKARKKIEAQKVATSNIYCTTD